MDAENKLLLFLFHFLLSNFHWISLPTSLVTDPVHPFRRGGGLLKFLKLLNFFFARVLKNFPFLGGRRRIKKFSPIDDLFVFSDPKLQWKILFFHVFFNLWREFLLPVDPTMNFSHHRQSASVSSFWPLASFSLKSWGMIRVQSGNHLQTSEEHMYLYAFLLKSHTLPDRLVNHSQTMQESSPFMW